MFDNQQPQQERKDKKKIFTKYVIPGLGLIAILSIVFAGSLYVAQGFPSLFGSDTETQSGTTTDPREIEKLVNKVSDLILLPPGESPEVATVNDLSQVRSQDFFRNAQVGDKVLIYAAARKAYLYRPDSHKLIEVGIVSQGNPNEAVSGAQDETPQIITPTPLPTTGPIEILPDQAETTPIVTPAISPTGSVLDEPSDE